MKQPIKMTPGDDTHLSLLMAPHSLNLAVGQLREQLLGYGRAAFVAGHAQLRASTPEAAEDLIEEIIERISDHAVKVISHHEARKQGDTEQIESARQAVFQADDWIKRDLRILAMRPSSNPGASHCLYQIQEPATKTEALAHYSQQAILAMDEAAPAAVAVPAEVTGLLEALESMVDVCEGHDFDGAPSDAHMDKARVAISAYRAALAATPAATAQARGGELNQFLSAAKDAGITHLPMSFGEALRELEAATGTVVLPEPGAVISEVMELVKDWAQRDFIAVEAGIDTLTEESTDKQHQEAKRLDGEAETAYRAIESKLRALLATGGQAQAVTKDEATWCSYIAGMIGCYLKEEDESPRVKAIAGIIERRLWALPSPQAQADARDAEQYRLLLRGQDTIQADDEFLREDGVTWRKDPSGIFVGIIYEGNILLPARRAIAAQAAAQGGA